MNKLKQLLIVLLSAVFLNNNIISMEQAEPDQEILESNFLGLPNEIWNIIFQEVIEDFFPNIECENLEDFDQNFKNIWLTNEDFKEKLYQLKLVCRDFIYFIESDKFYGEIRKKIYQCVIDSKLIAAVKNNDEEMVKSLIEKGANVNSKDKYGHTALIYASEEGYKEIAKLLIDGGANVNATNKSKVTALMWASQKGYKEIVQLLIEAGANVNAKDEDEETALVFAFRGNHEEIVELLIQEGADVYVKDCRGFTTLMWASKRKHKKIVEILIKAGVEINAKDKYGQTALIFAFPTRLGETLLQAFIDIINNVDLVSNSSEGNEKEILEMLIEAGADVNAKDDWGNTALIKACKSGYKKIVELLLYYEADVNAKNDWGNTALMVASERGHEEIVQLLEYAVIMSKYPRCSLF